MLVYTFHINLVNTSFFISDKTVKSLARLVRKCSKIFTNKGTGVISNGKVLYIKTDIKQIELNNLIKEFLPKYKHLQCFTILQHTEECELLVKSKKVKRDIMIDMRYDDLINDAYHHNYQYPDYGTINEKGD